MIFIFKQNQFLLRPAASVINLFQNRIVIIYDLTPLYYMSTLLSAGYGYHCVYAKKYKYIFSRTITVHNKTRLKFVFFRLERLYGMITDLYIDHNKFKVNIMYKSVLPTQRFSLLKFVSCFDFSLSARKILENIII